LTDAPSIDKTGDVEQTTRPWDDGRTRVVAIVTATMLALFAGCAAGSERNVVPGDDGGTATGAGPGGGVGPGGQGRPPGTAPSARPPAIRAPETAADFWAAWPSRTTS
jgi:hypothetical protein